MSKSELKSREHLDRLHRVLREAEYQPEWRNEAARCFQYYEGNQLPPSLIAELRNRSLPVLTTNLIQPTINGVLGMEARSRTDWFVQADNDEHAEVAQALNQRVNEALRTSKANRATSDAYKSQVIGGIGWVEVKRNRDPLGSKYTIKNIHRDEIFFDWRSSPDLSDCKWMLRARWVDVDEAVAVFPDRKNDIQNSIRHWASADVHERAMRGEQLSHGYSEYQYSTRDESEWLDSTRSMVKVYELYYRVWEHKAVISSPDGSAAVFDENNAIHVELVASGKVRVEKRSVPSLRLSWYVGIHHIADMVSPHPHNYFPYVPFFGAQEDKTNVPYGLVRSMLTPQDEVNYRRIKLTAALNFRRILMDEDASKMSDAELLEEVNRADGLIKLNPMARRKGGGLFKVETDQGIAAQQFQIMQDAEETIQAVAGVYNAYLGRETGGQSGVAINSLVEQGATTLADMNDNYRFARQMVGELVLAHEVNELKELENVSVFIPQQLGQQRKEVVLNQRDDQTGEISNVVAKAHTQVVMGDIQQSSGYRAQVTKLLTDFVSKMPDSVKINSLDMVIEQMDLPEEHKIRLLKSLRKATGEVDTSDLTEEEIAAMQQQQQAEQEKAAMVEKIQMADLQIGLAEREAKVAKLKAEAHMIGQRAGTEQIKQESMIHDMKNASSVPPPFPSKYTQPQARH